MLVFSACPRCQQQVTIPTGVEPTMLVHCPLCDAEYPLSEALPAIADSRWRSCGPVVAMVGWQCR